MKVVLAYHSWFSQLLTVICKSSSAGWPLPMRAPLPRLPSRASANAAVALDHLSHLAPLVSVLWNAKLLPGQLYGGPKAVVVRQGPPAVSCCVPPLATPTAMVPGVQAHQPVPAATGSGHPSVPFASAHGIPGMPAVQPSPHITQAELSQLFEVTGELQELALRSLQALPEGVHPWACHPHVRAALRKGRWWSAVVRLAVVLPLLQLDAYAVRKMQPVGLTPLQQKGGGRSVAAAVATSGVDVDGRANNVQGGGAVGEESKAAAGAKAMSHFRMDVVSDGELWWLLGLDPDAAGGSSEGSSGSSSGATGSSGSGSAAAQDGGVGGVDGAPQPAPDSSFNPNLSSYPGPGTMDSLTQLALGVAVAETHVQDLRWCDKREIQRVVTWLGRIRGMLKSRGYEAGEQLIQSTSKVAGDRSQEEALDGFDSYIEDDDLLADHVEAEQAELCLQWRCPLLDMWRDMFVPLPARLQQLRAGVAL